MQKIITALDGLNLSQSALDYTVFVSQFCEPHIVGIFLDDPVYHSYRFSDLISKDGGLSDSRQEELNRQDEAVRDQSVTVAEQVFQKAGLNYSIHRDKNVAIQELLHEAIYADLLIIDRKETFTHFEQEPPTDFLKELLRDVQCPVLVVPTTYQPVKKLVMLYDGEASSVYSVKMLSYLLPQLKQMQPEVLFITGESDTSYIPDERLMKEFMNQHFPTANYIVMKGNVREQITEHLNQLEENVLIVLGAHSRRRLSRWLKPSLADHILKNITLPLFITHSK